MADAGKKSSRKKPSRTKAAAQAKPSRRRRADPPANERDAAPLPTKSSGSRPSAGSPSRSAIDARRERVAKLLVAAKSTRQIADEVGASVDTVRQDISAIRASEKKEEEQPSRPAGKRPTKLSPAKQDAGAKKASKTPSTLVADMERAKKEGRLDVLADETRAGQRIVLLRVRS